jgi:hypothetical protein
MERWLLTPQPNKSSDKTVIPQYLQNLGKPHDEYKVHYTLFTLIEKIGLEENMGN